MHPPCVLEMVLNVAKEGADAVVVLCTNLAGATICEEAQLQIGRTVLDSVEETLNSVREASRVRTA